MRGELSKRDHPHQPLRATSVHEITFRSGSTGNVPEPNFVIVDTYLGEHKIQAVIPIKEDQKANRFKRGSSGGRPPNFDAEQYKERNTVERCFNKLRQFRVVATRFDKREVIYPGTIDVASIKIWLRDPVP